MGKGGQSESASTAARRGRPPRLTLERILETALEIGLDALTMTRLATRLGVAKGALYGYVGGRDELVRLATAYAGQRHPFPEDCGQPWPSYALEHARALFDLLTGDAQLIASYLSGGLGAVVQTDRTEAWVAALTKRGFTGEEALLLEQAIGFTVLGAAVNYRHALTLKVAGAPHSQQARDAVRKRPAEDLPLLRQHLDTFARDPEGTSWEKTVLLLLHGVTTARHLLDPAPADSALDLNSLAGMRR